MKTEAEHFYCNGKKQKSIEFVYQYFYTRSTIMKNYFKQTSRAMVLSGMLFTFLLSGCSSNGVNPEVIFSILGTMDWGRTEFGQGDSGNEPTGTHNSTPNDSRYCEYKDVVSLIFTYIYGP